jgi:hypothetical protein
MALARFVKWCRGVGKARKTGVAKEGQSKGSSKEWSKETDG